MNGILEWVIFLSLSAIAVITAAGMILTMSMYRAGLALMVSFVALAGLFILLNADLLAAIQIMMNVGGMLVMVLFMVMIIIGLWGHERRVESALKFFLYTRVGSLAVLLSILALYLGTSPHTFDLPQIIAA